MWSHFTLGTVWSGILPLFGVLSVSTMQFFTGCWCIADSSNDLWFLSVTLRAPGEVPHIQSQGTVFFIVSSNSDCMWYGPILVLTTGCSRSHFYFLCCEGALSCPHLSQEMFITWYCLDRKRTKLPSLVFRTYSSSFFIGVLNPEIRLSEKREKLHFSEAGEKQIHQDGNACGVPKINKNNIVISNS